MAEKTPSEPLANLYKTVIDVALLRAIEQADQKRFDILLETNGNYPNGRAAALAALRERHTFLADAQTVSEYLIARLTPTQIRTLVEDDQKESPHAVHRIWLDHQVYALLDRSVGTVKGDAAGNAFGAGGQNIVWAVCDSGIDRDHPHFAHYKNLSLPDGISHRDFTTDGTVAVEPSDRFGHGTHVAGILAGFAENIQAAVQSQTLDKEFKVTPGTDVRTIARISGVAPQCKLVSLQVLDANGRGRVSAVLQALQYIQTVNDYGRRLRIHGVNLSLGYPFDAEWFACGQSPLCVEVNRLVKSGVVAVVAAGNSGYGRVVLDSGGTDKIGFALSINDPGNADLAITVGSTHRESPHTYGISYFSSRGPTFDGRRKPDLVAPGEKIVSCAAADKRKAKGLADDVRYIDDSGTSMAAPHVSGAIALFLSVRREFIGQPERVKEIFLATATDLRREPGFQGAGLVDVLRALQSV